MAGKPVTGRKDATPEQIENARALKKEFGTVQHAIWDYLVREIPVDTEFTSFQIAKALGISTSQVGGPLGRFHHADYRLERVNMRTYVLREIPHETPEPQTPVDPTGNAWGPDGKLNPVPAYVLQRDGTDLLIWFGGQLFVASPYS